MLENGEMVEEGKLKGFGMGHRDEEEIAIERKERSPMTGVKDLKVLDIETDILR